MSGARKFLNLPSDDKLLLVEAGLLVVFVRLGLWLLPFRVMRRVSQGLGTWGLGLGARGAKSGAARRPVLAPERIAWAVSVVSHYIPCATCLTLALACQALLGRRGYPAQLRIGVARCAHGRMQAHAWVEVDGRAIIGDDQNLARYAVLPPIDRARRVEAGK